MNDLRSEIRAAFEKEQSAHPPIGGLRGNLTSAATSQARPRRNLQWMAVAIAAALALLVVGGLMSTRLGPRASVPSNTKTIPTADYGPPPAGVQLVYVHDPSHPTWLIGYDWSGKPRGTVKIPADVAPDASAVRMAPDGSGFEVGGTYKGGTGIFLDRLGHPIVTQTGQTGLVGAMWADDNQHQCVLTLSSTYVWRIATQLPGQPLRSVAVIARDPAIGQSGISLAACSFHHDVAIAVRTTIAWPGEIWVIRLSDGTVLAHHVYSATARLSTLVASPDGIYVAESSAKARGFDSPDASQGADSTIIRRVSDWQVVASLDSSVQVLSFSGDGSLVLTESTSASGQVGHHYSALDWRLNQAMNSYDGEWSLDSFTAQPGGPGFALALGDPPYPRPPCDEGTPGCPAFHPVRVIEYFIPHLTGAVANGDYFPAW
jgi:hypothetical protein